MRKWILIAILLLLAAFDLLTGDGIGWADEVILWKLRFPRMLTAVIAGGSMAVCGTQMQALFRNPLADPHIMGVSGGAGLGAAIAAIAMGGASAFAGSVSLVSAAFIGALFSSVVILAAASRVHSTGTLLLVGVMLGFALSAVSSVLQYSAGEESLKLFYSWMAGSFSAVPSTGLAIMAFCFVLAYFLAFLNFKALDLILFGDEYASFSGVRLRGVRLSVITGCALSTAAVTAFCGPIGFVGIAAPHLARRIFGTSVHRRALPWSAVCGACLALSADILSHIGPTPLPVGSTLALVGIPIVVVILWRNRL